MTPEELQARLFYQATRPRKWHKEPEIVLPKTIAPIPEDELFSTDKRLRILELGSGWGEHARTVLQKNPKIDYVAFEIKPDRIFQTIKYIRSIPGARIRIVPVNYHWFLEEILPKSAFDRIVINFPDPWPKRRHWKHRLVQAGFPERMARLLHQNGELRIATDYGPYARRILRIFRKSQCFAPLFTNPDYKRERPAGWEETKFERIQKSQGKHPYYMAWKKL